MRLGTNSSTKWVNLTACLSDLPTKPDRRHTIRYVDGLSKRSWKNCNGRAPRVNVDYSWRFGERSGGQDDGVSHGHVDFLNHVFIQCHASEKTSLTHQHMMYGGWRVASWVLAEGRDSKTVETGMGAGSGVGTQ